MKKNWSIKVVCLLILFCLLSTSGVAIRFNQISSCDSVEDGGFTLFSPLSTRTTYLIDIEGNVIHQWDSEYPPGNSAYLLNDGSIVRAGRSTISAQTGGRIQRINCYNEIIWDYSFISDAYVQHHDIEPLPNGNVLLIAREIKTRDEAIQAGRNPSTISWDILETEFLVEVKPTGPTTGEIIWEWHVWDHLIQEYDPTNEYYGDVSEHAELININYQLYGTNEDWIHMNSVDYHEGLDQIMVTSRNFGEFWIIDHSTTSEEAAGHIGGRYGKGGDLLYRWGNPQTYGLGTENDQTLEGPHDATWIEKGCPGEGHVLVYNNWASSVDEISLPVDENGLYERMPGMPFSPDYAHWKYWSQDIYAHQISGAQRLSNGNTLICVGTKGYFLEVTQEKDIIWEYINPYGLVNSVYKIRRYYMNLNFLNQPKLPTINGHAKGEKGRIYTYSISTIDPNNDSVYYMIDWGDESVQEWLGPFLSGEIVTFQHTWTNDGEYIIKVKAKDINDEESDWSELSVSMPKNKPYINTPLLDFLENHPSIFPILRQLLGYNKNK